MLGRSETGAERLGRCHLTVRCTSSVLSDELDWTWTSMPRPLLLGAPKGLAGSLLEY